MMQEEHFEEDRFLSLQAIAISPSSDSAPERLFVALHGWGASAEDLAGLSDFLHLPDYQLIFPDAPFPHPYSPWGKMWYDLPAAYSFRSQPAFHYQPGLVESRQRLIDWLKSLDSLTGVPLNQTVLAGFSQGGAMTLDVGLHLPLAALIVLSGYLHAPVQLPLADPPPVYMAHGRHDPVVPLMAAQEARDSLLQAGVRVNYVELDMGHEVSPVVLQQIQSFLATTIR